MTRGENRTASVRARCLHQFHILRCIDMYNATCVPKISADLRFLMCGLAIWTLQSQQLKSNSPHTVYWVRARLHWVSYRKTNRKLPIRSFSHVSVYDSLCQSCHWVIVCLVRQFIDAAFKGNKTLLGRDDKVTNRLAPDITHDVSTNGAFAWERNFFSLAWLGSQQLVGMIFVVLGIGVNLWHITMRKNMLSKERFWQPKSDEAVHRVVGNLIGCHLELSIVVPHACPRELAPSNAAFEPWLVWRQTAKGNCSCVWWFGVWLVLVGPDGRLMPHSALPWGVSVDFSHFWLPGLSWRQVFLEPSYC